MVNAKGMVSGTCMSDLVTVIHAHENDLSNIITYYDHLHTCWLGFGQVQFQFDQILWYAPYGHLTNKAIPGLDGHPKLIASQSVYMATSILV